MGDNYIDVNISTETNQYFLFEHDIVDTKNISFFIWLGRGLFEGSISTSCNVTHFLPLQASSKITLFPMVILSSPINYYN